ncbi:MAG: DUF2490 domain-containing protein [Bacteroidales bacterium]|nr:DUF2490 domain-containing protein [Bacteroidales bacterium]
MIRLCQIFFLLVFVSGSFAQVNDAGLWTEISIEKKFSQSLSIEYSNSERFNENITELGSIINELGIKYRFNKDSRISFFYRLNYSRQLNNMYEPISRFYFDYSRKFKLSNFDLDLRIRLKTQQKSTHFYDFDSESSNVIRPRIKLSYSYKKFEPYCFFETYHPVIDGENIPIEKIRFVIGLEYSPDKIHSFDLGYMIQRELYENNPYTDFVVRVGYKFRF